jgi:5'-3' exonuclease
MIEKNNSVPILPEVQLAYVLPRPSLKLLPNKFHELLLNNNSENYPTNCRIYWAFCKYFWESHVDLPPIDLDELKILFNEKDK